MRPRFFLLWLICLLAITVHGASSTVDVTWRWLDFMTAPQVGKRVTMTPLQPFVDYTNSLLSAAPIGKITGPAGIVTFSNVVAGYSYKVTFDTAQTSLSRTCGIPASLSGTNINGHDYLGDIRGENFYYLFAPNITIDVALNSVTNIARQEASNATNGIVFPVTGMATNGGSGTGNVFTATILKGNTKLDSGFNNGNFTNSGIFNVKIIGGLGTSGGSGVARMLAFETNSVQGLYDLKVGEDVVDWQNLLIGVSGASPDDLLISQTNAQFYTPVVFNSGLFGKGYGLTDIPASAITNGGGLGVFSASGSNVLFSTNGNVVTPRLTPGLTNLSPLRADNTNLDLIAGSSHVRLKTSDGTLYLDLSQSGSFTLPQGVTTPEVVATSDIFSPQFYGAFNGNGAGLTNIPGVTAFNLHARGSPMGGSGELDPVRVTTNTAFAEFTIFSSAVGNSGGRGTNEDFTTTRLRGVTTADSLNMSGALTIGGAITSPNYSFDSVGNLNANSISAQDLTTVGDVNVGGVPATATLNANSVNASVVTAGNFVGQGHGLNDIPATSVRLADGTNTHWTYDAGVGSVNVTGSGFITSIANATNSFDGANNIVFGNVTNATKMTFNPWSMTSSYTDTNGAFRNASNGDFNISGNLRSGTLSTTNIFADSIIPIVTPQMGSGYVIISDTNTLVNQWLGTDHGVIDNKSWQRDISTPNQYTNDVAFVTLGSIWTIHDEFDDFYTNNSAILIGTTFTAVDGGGATVQFRYGMTNMAIAGNIVTVTHRGTVIPYTSFTNAFASLQSTDRLDIVSGNHATTNALYGAPFNVVFDGHDHCLTNAIKRGVGANDILTGAMLGSGTTNWIIKNVKLIGQATVHEAQNAPMIGSVYANQAQPPFSNLKLDNVLITNCTVGIYSRSTNACSGSGVNCIVNTMKTPLFVLNADDSFAFTNCQFTCNGPDPIPADSANVTAQAARIFAGNIIFNTCSLKAYNPTNDAPDVPNNRTNATALFVVSKKPQSAGVTAAVPNVLCLRCAFDSGNVNPPALYVYDIANGFRELTAFDDEPGFVKLVNCSFNASKVFGPIETIP